MTAPSVFMLASEVREGEFMTTSDSALRVLSATLVGKKVRIDLSNGETIWPAADDKVLMRQAWVQ